VLFLLVSLVVGVRLLLLARRTRQLPELLIGTGFTVGGALGYVPEALIVDLELLHEGVAQVALVVANGAIRLAAALMLLFTWRVFRRDEAWAAWLAAGLCSVLVLAYVAYPGPWIYAADKREWWWSLVTAAARSACFAWASLESLRYHQRLRRRAKLGLADAALARRFLLWGLAMAGPALMSATPIATRALPASAGSPLVSLWQTLLGLGAALAMWRTFFPPAPRVPAPARSSS
jgi:hypothetical protein